MAITLTKSYQKIATISLTYGKIYTYAKYTTQDINNSKTTYMIKSTYYANRQVAFSSATAKLDGTSKSYGYTNFSKGEHTIQELTRTLPHSADGTSNTKTISTSWDATYGGDGSSSASIVAPKINRIATVSAGTDFSDEQGSNPTITFTNPGNLYVRPYVNFYGKTGSTWMKQKFGPTIAKFSSPLTFNIDSYKNEILQALTTNAFIDSENQTVYYNVAEGLQTFTSTSASSLISGSGNSKARKFTITNAFPDVNTPTFQELNENAITYYGTSADTIIQNLSEVQITINPTAKKYATIDSINIVNGDQESGPITSSPYTYTFHNIQSGEFSIVVNDSRGAYSTLSVTKNLIPYQNVQKIIYTANRVSPTSSNIKIYAESIYYQTTFGTTENKEVVQYQVTNKDENPVEANWITLTKGTDYTVDNTNNKITVDTTINNIINYRDNKIIHIQIKDKLSSWSEGVPITRGIPVFEFGNDEVQVNGDLYLADINRDNKINVSEKLYDTGWQTLTPLVGNWTVLRCRRIGNIVTVEGHISSWSYGGSATNISTLPELYRPVGKTEYFYGFEGGRRMSRWYITVAGSLGVDWVADISNGAVYTGATWHNFTISYMVNDNE